MLDIYVLLEDESFDHARSLLIKQCLLLEIDDDRHVLVRVVFGTALAADRRRRDLLLLETCCVGRR